MVSRWGLAALLVIAVAAVAEPLVTFTCDLPGPGEVSAAVYTPEGVLVRTLARGERRPGGPCEFIWDGLDRHGRPQLPGTYRWRLLWKPPFIAHYVAMLGAGHPAHPPLNNWIGNHDGPGAIAVDADALYIGAATNENVNVLVKTTLDGARNAWYVFGRERWLRGRWQGVAALASDGRGTVYALQQNGYLNVIDAATGKPRAAWDLLPPGVERRPHLYSHYSGARLAADGGNLVIAYRDLDRIAWIDTKTGAVAATTTVERPHDIAFGPGGALVAIAGDRVVTVDRGGVLREVVAADGSDPRCLAVAPTGELFTFAAATRQVRHFAADGSLLHTYGRAGGRQPGLFVAADFGEVTDLAVDPAGGFVIAEPSTFPRRVARFADDGSMLHTWYGGQKYWNWAVADPRNRRHVWINDGGTGEWIALLDLDYQTGRWEVLETHRVAGQAAGLVWCGAGGNDGRLHICYHGERRYLVFDRSLPIVFRHDDAVHALAPVVAGGIGDRQGIANARRLAGVDDTAGPAWLWTDLNGDSEPQPEEICLDLAVAPYNRTSSGGIGPDLACYNAVTQGNNLAIARRTVSAWTPVGVPRYAPVDDMLATAADWVERLPDQNKQKGGFYGNAGLLAGSDGAFYVMGNINPPEHGDRFPTNRAAGNRIARFDADGRLAWKLGRHAGAKFGSPPGYTHQLVGFLGEVHGCVIVGDRTSQPAEAWTADGLYAGEFLARRAEDGLPDRVYEYRDGPDGALLNGDCLATSSVFTLPDGDVIWFGPGQDSIVVYRISGWDGWQRRQGTVTLAAPPAHARGEGSGLTAAYFANPDLAGEPLLTRHDRRLWMSLDERFPQRRGGSRVLDAVHASRPTYAWPKDLPQGITADNFAARWTGTVEAPLGEPFTFSVYTRGSVRLWIDNHLLLEGGTAKGSILVSEPVELRAGQRCPVRIEYRSDTLLPCLSLNWESTSLERERIPQAFLYPAP